MLHHRKKILLVVLGLALLFYNSEWMWSVVMDPLQTLRQKQQTLQKEIARRELDLAKARKAAKTLVVWATESLPGEPQVARSLYQAWLLQLVSRVGLHSPAVDSTQPSARNGYVSITFSLQARGTLEQWTQFLYEFHRAGLLHQVRSLAITPIIKKEQLDINLTIEALVLPGAEQTDQLNEETSDRLAFKRLADYQLIVTRNLFGVGGAADPTDQTYLTGIHHVNGEPEAWFTLRNETDPDRAVVRLRRGQSLVIGQFQGQVTEIDDDDVILEADGERWLVALGENLGEAFALPPEF
ncbi:MAG: hypothetical protein NTY19_13120 [Planctomycetota bacterium]|nr:hypothetical protein [Planctomycetota bacterium]